MRSVVADRARREGGSNQGPKSPLHSTVPLFEDRPFQSLLANPRLFLGWTTQANRQTTVDCARADCSGWSGPMKESESELSALRRRRRCSHSFVRSKPNTQSAAVASLSLSLPVILKPHFAITLTKALIKTRRKGRRRRGGRETEPAEGGECGSAGSRGREEGRKWN